MSCSPSPALDQLLAAAAEDVKLADHAYQLAMAAGDMRKVAAALRFFRSCVADYNAIKKQQAPGRLKQIN